jgi:hypothetical protein
MEVGASAPQKTRLLVNEQALSQVATVHIRGWSKRSWFGDLRVPTSEGSSVMDRPE